MDVFATVATEATPVSVGALTEVAVIPFAVKFPPASLATMVEAPLELEAVVLAFAKVPEETLEALSVVNPEPLP